MLRPMGRGVEERRARGRRVQKRYSTSMVDVGFGVVLDCMIYFFTASTTIIIIQVDFRENCSFMC